MCAAISICTKQVNIEALELFVHVLLRAYQSIGITAHADVNIIASYQSLLSIYIIHLRISQLSTVVRRFP